MSARRSLLSTLRPGSVGLIGLLGTLTALGPLATDMYLPGLGAIEQDLHTGAGQGSLTVAVFFLGMAAGQLVYGPLSDRKGRRSPLLVGIALYVVGCLASALAPSFLALMLARIVTAIGGCSGIVIGRAIVRDHFDLEDSARVFSRLMLVMGVSPILAPLFGGLLLSSGFSWRVIFLFLAGLGALTLIAVGILLAESRSGDAARAAASEKVAMSFHSVLRDPDALGYIITGAFNQSAISVYVAVSPVVLIGIYGIRPEDFGWVFGVNGIGYIAASQLNVRLIRQHPPHALLGWASRAILVVALILLLCVITGFGGLWGVLVPLFSMMAVLGFNMPNALACAFARDTTRVGAISALMGAGQFGVGTLGATLASLAYDNSARPMATTILVLVVTANVAFYTLARRRRLV
ncbi:MAG: multidrug effflux MFS transporter [Rhizomicrobium sp.]